VVTYRSPIFELVEAPAARRAAIGLTEGTQVFKLERLSRHAGRPVCLEMLYVAGDWLPVDRRHAVEPAGAHFVGRHSWRAHSNHRRSITAKSPAAHGELLSCREKRRRDRPQQHASLRCGRGRALRPLDLCRRCQHRLRAGANGGPRRKN